MISRIHAAAILVAVLCPACVKTQSRAFSVEDDIAMVRFSDPLSDPTIPGSQNVQQSPDGDHFAIVTTKGILASDRIESDISIFDRKDIETFLAHNTPRPPTPRVIARIVSFPHREEPVAYAPVIKDLHWSPDGSTLYFKGESPTGTYQLYEAEIDGTRTRALTSQEESVGRFDLGRDLIVYTSSRPEVNQASRADWINADTQSISGHNLWEVLFPGQLTSIAPETFSLSVLRTVRGRWHLTRLPHYVVTDVPYMSFLFPFTLSPRGDKLIGMTPISTIPDSWEKYEPSSGLETLRFHGDDPRRTSASQFFRPQQYSLIDLASGRIAPMLDAPIGRILGYSANSRTTWAADERRVLLTNTFLQLNRGDEPRSEQRTRPCAVASVDLPSFAATCLFFETGDPGNDDMQVENVSFGRTDDDVRVSMERGASSAGIRSYHLKSGKWSVISTVDDTVVCGSEPPFQSARTGSSRSNIKLSIREGLNDAPTLWAANSRTTQGRELWDPNPQLQDLRFGDASMYRWKDKSGYEWSGILVKPVGYESGRRYPLVIQLYGYNERQFITDGLYPTAFAARELASGGIAVLQVRKKPNTLSESDPQDHLEAYRSAIESLVSEGLVDRSRVGVVGFSWTCWYAVNALINAPELFAAATIADGIDNSYMQYMFAAVEDPTIQRQMDKIRGAQPLGEGLNRWVAEAPEFHLDQVKAPVRIEAIGAPSVLQEWELYASLRLQRKPVDFIYFPHGTHIHQKPLERHESQQGDVDWFRFWLEDYEDPDPKKVSQYQRWRELREERGKSTVASGVN